MNPARPPTAACFDPALVARYDVDGPRYTSYPTAPHFRADFGEADLRRAILASNEDPIPRDVSAYVHVPFCLSPCFYCGCARIVTRDRSRAGGYLARLYREIEAVAALFARDRRLAQLHFGGGTPNFLDADQLVELIDTLGRHFAFSQRADREFGVEIDPRHCDAGYVRRIAAAGINRLSIGVQDFDADVQHAINRVQSVESTRAVMEGARDAGIRSINLDLIYGLPKQTEASFARTLEQVIALRPERIAAYGYAHLPERFRAQRRIDRFDLPDAGARLGLLQLAVERLDAAGYRYIGVDHFALPHDDLARAAEAGTLQRNFQGYSTHAACDLVGFGMSAISRVGDTFSQNARDLPDYYAALDDGRLPTVRGLRLDRDDRLRADAIQQLMCAGVLDVPAFEARHLVRFAEYFRHSLERLQALAADGLVQCTPERIAVTPRGQFLLRNIAMCFDAYVGAGAQRVRYSRAV
ncbi:oxygen-independent coproporphyrinogen III oxidase [Dokdonella ginsengisoli]|uniref:Coproporphyrinogen-III oxidase n=1 Tax=Dokdonella ginsengisoli TaxID=363846 RepID=A0ABV9QVP9_9GAMM